MELNNIDNIDKMKDNKEQKQTIDYSTLIEYMNRKDINCFK